jgi:succinoglycan biosynthesis transport protein ExoP
MDLRRYGRVLRAHSVLILVSLLASTGAAVAIAWIRQPIYETSAQLYIARAGTSSDPTLVDQVPSYAALATSRSVVQSVIDQLRLPYGVQELQQAIKTDVPPGTALIELTVRDGSPERAKAIADAVGKQFSSFLGTVETIDGVRPRYTVTVTGAAEVPTSPVAPLKLLYILLGVLAGLVIGLVGTVVREALDNRIRAEDEAAAISGAPVLGAIFQRPRARKRPLVMLDDPFSARAEAYRRLRTNLAAVGGTRRRRDPGAGDARWSDEGGEEWGVPAEADPGSAVRLAAEHRTPAFVISSAVASEGKTVIAANLGIAFAQAGYRVALVDADLRRPSLADTLGLSRTKGLSDVLGANYPVAMALQTWRHDLPLEILGSGLRPPNPSELLGSARFSAALSELRDRADVVLIDAPALLLVADAAVAARSASGVILVTRVGSTRLDQLENAARALRAAGESLLGVVLNGAPAPRAWPYRYDGASLIRYGERDRKHQAATRVPPPPVPGRQG